MTQEIGQAMGRVFQGWSQWAQGDPEAAGVTALSTVATLGVGGLAAWWRARRNRERQDRGRSVVRVDAPAGDRVRVEVGEQDSSDA